MLTQTNSRICVFDFQTAAQKLNAVLKKKQPKMFSPFWIKYHKYDVYTYLCKNVRTETGEVDWDAVTITLDKTFQRRWQTQGTKGIIPYENKKELEKILSKYKSKLYTLLNPLDEEDKKVQDKIFISMVRIAQNGNIVAQQYIVEWCTLIIHEWIDEHEWICKWKGYTSDIEERIQGCIRCYRYTGTFIGYLFRTFQYSARGLRPILSLDSRIGCGKKTRIDYVLQEND